MKSRIASLLAVVALTGCGADIPAEKLTSAAVYRIAERDVYDGLEIINFERENGWIDTNAQNIYTVRYNYEILLTKSLPEVILALAQQIQKDAKQGNISNHQLEHNLEILNVYFGGEEKTLARFNRVMENCLACIHYVYATDADSGETNYLSAPSMDRILYFARAWFLIADRYGFSDDAAAGETESRYAWQKFMKTEKGWKELTND